MNRLVKLIIFFTLFALSLIKAQNQSVLFPSGLNIQPFIASALEPKLGFLRHVNEKELRLDIGNSVDLLHLNYSQNRVVSIGADLFTFTLLRGEPNFHFPVDAIDYLFGINLSYKQVFDGHEFGLRFRLSHISAHFVDGHYSGQEKKWRDDLNPRIYSREFMELMPFYRYGLLRFYTGLTYLIHVDPEYLGKRGFQAGLEIFAPDILGDDFTPYLGYDFKLTNINSYTGINSLNLGLKFGNARGRGVSIYFLYYSGKSIHGQYFDRNNEYAALGVNLDL